MKKPKQNFIRHITMLKIREVLIEKKQAIMIKSHIGTIDKAYAILQC